MVADTEMAEPTQTAAEVLEQAGLPSDGGQPFDGGQTAPIDKTGEMSPEEANANAPDWRDTLPADLRSSPALAKYAKVEDLAKAHTELEALRGTSIRIPGPDADDAARAEFYKKVVDASGGRIVPRPDHDDAESMNALMSALGRPESADAYTAPTLGEDMPELDAETFGAFKSLAHEVGLTQGQLEKIVQFDANRLKAAHDAASSTVQQQQTELANEWGMAYEPRMQNAVQFLERSGAPEALRDAVANRQVDAQTMKWLHGIVAQGAEGAPIGQQPENNEPEGALPPAEAEKRMNEALEAWQKLPPGDPNIAYYKAQFDKYAEMAHAGAAKVEVI